MKKWFSKFTGWPRGKWTGPLSSHREPHTESTIAIPTRVAGKNKAPVIIWTLDEAETAWRAGRTKYNLGETFRTFAGSLESMAGSFLVDGNAARVVVCVNAAVKKRILSAPRDKTGVLGVSPAQRGGRRIEDIECTNCHATFGGIQAWRLRGPIVDGQRDFVCCEGPYDFVPSDGWTCSEDLMWRSLPSGEDR